MVGSINKVILVGNVGKDPEIRTTQDNKEIANFPIATSESWRDKATGERRDRTEWHRIVIFNEGLVNIIKNYVHKGSKLYIEGSLHTRKWNDNSGVEKYTTEIVLQGYNCTLTILDSKNSGGQNTSENSHENQGSASNFADMDDEIPF
ncbi:single-stranded DNA-binding protein [Rickettsiales endosymbiont of Stachyamoeba lipophora]|uniref:single-stranded DNA-binding protein n=1 Tax=Rickettsiales endosymbiont of Stachyamoeba lipophora TaxID=2486578 RepID=UPI000F650CDA|nr:single-stranded DNA-binding protein [Rickettsiales endosymbiont of Stachyamoeba lipophora]AZL15496.1 single-stranded DNA-binding protein [Rickettsiales endosymbiont of Stachyamoeba lipophora]